MRDNTSKHLLRLRNPLHQPSGRLQPLIIPEPNTTHFHAGSKYLASFRKNGDVRNASDVQKRPTLLHRPERDEIEKRHERRTLASDRHVRDPKITHRRDAGELRECGRIADLQRGADRLAEHLHTFRDMLNRLPVRAD